MPRNFHTRSLVAFGFIIALAAPGATQTAPEVEQAQPTRSEMREKLNQMEIDHNSSEARKMQRERIKFLMGADSNRDDILTKEELLNSIHERFEKVDRNGDGMLDFGDKPAFAPRARFERAISPIIERSDVDGSGGVSLAEFEQQPLQGFDAFDEDSSGSVDLPAMIAAIESIGQN